MKYLLIPIVTILGMLGGQIATWIRRYTLPSVSVLWAFITDKRVKKDRWKYFAFLLLIPVLSMGYGVKSFYAKIFHKEWLIRLMYSLTLSIPFLFFGFIKYSICTLFLVGAFQIHAGGFKVGKYDFLWEDFFRYSVLGTNIIICIS